MKKISNPIIFFGTENLSLRPLESLIDNGFNVVAVVTKPDAKSGRKQKIKEPDIKVVAKAHGIRVFQPTKASEINDYITTLPESVGVLVSYGKIIPQATIDCFKYGIINIHPSLLPKYRGPSPIESAILNEDREAGVTLMGLIDKMDAGPIYAQEVLALTGTESKSELYKKLSEMGSKTLESSLESIIDGSLKPRQQNEQEATYCKKLDKSMSLLQPRNHPASKIFAQIRAYQGFPKPKIILNNTNCVILEAHISEEPKTIIDQKCLDNNYIVIDRLVPENKSAMSANEFINGFLRT